MTPPLTPVDILNECLREANGDTEAALLACEYILSTDSSGHQHKGKGIGGGQFTGAGEGSSGTDKVKNGSIGSILFKGNKYLPIDKPRTVERYGEAGKRGFDKAGIFFSPKGKGAQEYGVGSRPLLSTIKAGTLLFVGTSTIQFSEDNNLLDKKLPPEIIAYTGCTTLREVQEKDLNGEIDTDTYYDAFQTVARNELERSGFQGSRWLQEEDLAPVQYQIWDKNCLDTGTSLSIFFAYDIHNHVAQGILNRSLKAARGLSTAARKDLTAALKLDPTGVGSGQAILDFINKYRLQLARLLNTTQLAALLEGAREVAEKVPPLGTVPIEGLPIAEQERILEASVLAPPLPTHSIPQGVPEEVHLVNINNAVKDLAERNVLTRPQYDALDAAARQKAFTVAGVDAEETLTKIRDTLAENVAKGADYETFAKEVAKAVDEGTFLSDAHQETVFRTNVQTAFSDGQAAVLNNPLVRSGFPYSAYDAIHDDRVRENHLALEHHGIGGTNIYRNDDPVFQMFRPPWDYNDRCSWTPITVRHAAEKGIAEAQEWLETGVEPSAKAFVPMPPFTPPAGFQRALNSAPLSIRLSLQSLDSFGVSLGWVTVGGKEEGDAKHKRIALSVDFSKDDYPRNTANQFLDKYIIAGAACCVEEAATLRDSIPEDQRYKLDRLIQHLQMGGTVHHPSEPSGFGIDLHGNIPDEDWAKYQDDLVAWEEWNDRQETRHERLMAANRATRTIRRKEVDYDNNDAALEEAGATKAELRAIAKIRHRVKRGTEPEGLLENLYEETLENIYWRLERDESDDKEPEEPEAPALPSISAVFGFDPDEKRDESGKWTAGGGSGKSSEVKEVKKHDSPNAAAAAAEYKTHGTKAKAFKSWFGDWETDPASASKVVNTEGEPQETHGTAKKVFHGTYGKFDAFDKDRANAANAGTGFYFAENRELANTFGEVSDDEEDEGGRIIEAYLNIRNPFIFEDHFKASNAIRILEDAKVPVPKSWSGTDDDTVTGYDIWQTIRETVSHKYPGGKGVIGTDKVNELLQEAGYDGLSHMSSDLMGSIAKPGSPTDGGRCWIAFEPNQIKHVDNQGTFDSANPNIKLAVDSGSDTDRLQLISEIFVLLFGDDASAQARKLLSPPAALSIFLATPKVTKRYGKRPGPGWTSGGTSKKGTPIWNWAPSTGGGAATPPAPTPRPTPTPPAPTAPAPAPSPTPAPTSGGPALQSVAAAARAAGIGLKGGTQAKAASAAAHAVAMAKLSAGQQLDASDKAALATKLTNMPTALLRSLSVALGGPPTAANAKAMVASVKAILTSATPPTAAPIPSTAPPPTPPAPTPPTTPTPGAATPSHLNTLSPHIRDVGAQIRSIALAEQDGHMTQAEAEAEIVRLFNTITHSEKDILISGLGHTTGRATTSTDILNSIKANDPGHPIAAPSPPGPPPRPGLVWNPTTHRWTRPASPFANVFGNLTRLSAVDKQDVERIGQKVLSGSPTTQNDVITMSRILSTTSTKEDHDLLIAMGKTPNMALSYDQQIKDAIAALLPIATPSTPVTITAAAIFNPSSNIGPISQQAVVDIANKITAGTALTNAEVGDLRSLVQQMDTIEVNKLADALNVPRSYNGGPIINAAVALLPSATPTSATPTTAPSRLDSLPAPLQSVAAQIRGIALAEQSGLMTMNEAWDAVRIVFRAQSFADQNIIARTIGVRNPTNYGIDNLIDAIKANDPGHPAATPSPPGPPPRPGLIWNPTTHRWILPPPTTPTAPTPGVATPLTPAQLANFANVFSTGTTTPAQQRDAVRIAVSVIQGTPTTNQDVSDMISALGGMTQTERYALATAMGLPFTPGRVATGNSIVTAVQNLVSTTPTAAPTTTPTAKPGFFARMFGKKGKAASAAATAAGTATLPPIPYKDEENWESGKAAPASLNGIDFKPAPPKFWEKTKDVDIGEPPTHPGVKVHRASVMIQEPDGRIWIVQPTNEFGGRKYTLPGGGVEPGLTDQQNALKEVWEETGLQVEITGHVGDFQDSNYPGSTTRGNGRLYIGRRIGGEPWGAKVESHIISNKTGKPAAESETITLVTPEKAAKLLHRTDDLAQLMSVNPISITQKSTGTGSEPLKKLIHAIQPTVKQYDDKLTAAGKPKKGNPYLHAVQQMRGYNEKPQVVAKADMDDLVAKGDHIELLRGVQDAGYGSGRQTAKQLADAFKTGDHFPGHGVFGSGTYTDGAKGYSNVANSQYGSGGAVIRMALPKTAKIITVDELQKKVGPPPKDFQNGSYNRGNGSAEECWLGVQAALAGYDAIRSDGKQSRHSGYLPHCYIILNRSILVVQKEDATGHKIK